MSKSDKEGILCMLPSGRWAVCRPGQAPVEITSGEVFRVEDPAKEGLAHHARSEQDATGRRTVVQIQQVADARYFDAAGYPGRTVRLCVFCVPESKQRPCQPR
jgi:hypothetical protein